MNSTADSYEEIAPGIFRLGGYLPLDGRLSWAPKREGCRQPLSCYLLLKGDRPHLIDTGAACHRQLILDQLERLVPREKEITAFTTRNEYQCVGNINVIHNSVQLKELYFFGINPFAAYDDISSGMPDVEVTILDVASSKPLQLKTAPSLSIMSTPIKILGTFWAYEAETRTLFSSDWFGYTFKADKQRGAIINNIDDELYSYDLAREFITYRFHWLEIADTRPMVMWLEKLFADFEIETIAPTFGCVLKGKDVVSKHFELSLDVLKRVGR